MHMTKKVAFKNNAPFNSCITKINNTLIINAEDSDIVMPMYNLIEYSRNYRKTTGSLWNYYRNEPNSGFDGEGNSRINYSILRIQNLLSTSINKYYIKIRR